MNHSTRNLHSRLKQRLVHTLGSVIALGTLSLGAQAQFGPPSVVDTFLNYRQMSSGDFDGDGRRDIVMAVRWDRLYWYRNLGNGAFSSKHAIPKPQNYADTTTLTTADVDGDGDVDIIAGITTHSQAFGSEYDVYVLENLGNSTFGLVRVTWGTNDHASGLDLADIDGDGIADLVFHDYSQGEVVWCRNAGNPGSVSFDSPIVITAGIAASGALRIFDLDENGTLDVMLADPNSDRVIWYANDGSGGFGGMQIVATGIESPQSIDAADLDQDGDLDVLVGSIHKNVQTVMIPGEVTWYENLGGGVFGPGTLMYSAYPGGSFSVRTVDMEGDGRVDIVYTVFDAVHVHRNLGAGQFGAQQVIAPATFACEDVIPEDFDGDGLRDLVVGLSGVDQIDLIRQVPSTSATAFCGADAASFPCPCQNAGTRYSGCANSTGQGVSLAWFGSPSLASDDFTLLAHDGPANLIGLLLEGSSPTSLPVMDGQLCAGGTVRRLSLFQFDSEGSALLSYNLPSLSGNLAVQDARYYQAWYRDPVMSPCGNLGNFSNGMVVTWQQ